MRVITFIFEKFLVIFLKVYCSYLYKAATSESRLARPLIRYETVDETTLRNLLKLSRFVGNSARNASVWQSIRMD